MRFLLFTCMVAALAACAGRPTLEELEAEALRTGDWSAVEQRERRRLILRQRESGCPDGFTRVCTGPEIQAQCRCLNPRALTSAASSN